MPGSKDAFDLKNLELLALDCLSFPSSPPPPLLNAFARETFKLATDTSRARVSGTHSQSASQCGVNRLFCRSWKFAFTIAELAVLVPLEL